MKVKYKLSKNYRLFYRLLVNGYIIVCFVDYDFNRHEKSKPCRDVCKAKRFKEFDIQVGARGIEYFGVRKWDKEKGTELQVLINKCKQSNLQFIKP